MACGCVRPYMPFSVGIRLRDAGAIGRRPLANSLTDTSNPSGTSTVAIGPAGFPCTIVFGGTDFVTTLPVAVFNSIPLCHVVHIMQHVRVRNHHALWLASAARCEKKIRYRIDINIPRLPFGRVS